MQQIVLASLDKDVIRLIARSNRYKLLGFLDKNPLVSDEEFPNLGDDSQWRILKSRYPNLQVALVVDPPKLKKKLALHYGLENLATLIAESAIVDDSAQLGEGILIQEGCFISRHVRIGKSCKMNIRAMLHHDVEVGEFSTIAPGAQLLGNVKVGSGCFIGAGAILLPHVRIDDDVIIGAGAVVTKSVSANQTVCGVPARTLMKT